MTMEKPVPTSHANCLIQEVVLRHEPGDMLVATVVSNASETGQFAFHLYRNGGRLHVQDYSPNPVYCFGIDGKAGLYLVLSYLRTPDSTPITKYSNPLFLYPVDYGQGKHSRSLSKKNVHSFCMANIGNFRLCTIRVKSSSRFS